MQTCRKKMCLFETSKYLINKNNFILDRLSIWLYVLPKIKQFEKQIEGERQLMT